MKRWPNLHAVLRAVREHGGDRIRALCGIAKGNVRPEPGFGRDARKPRFDTLIRTLLGISVVGVLAGHLEHGDARPVEVVSDGAAACKASIPLPAVYRIEDVGPAELAWIGLNYPGGKAVTRRTAIYYQTRSSRPCLSFCLMEAQSWSVLRFH
jgi:hypothetical protein